MTEAFDINNLNDILNGKCFVNDFDDNPFVFCLENNDFETFLKLRNLGYRLKKLRADHLFQIINKDNLEFFDYFFQLDAKRFVLNPFLIHQSVKSKSLKIFQYLLSVNTKRDSKIYWQSQKYTLFELIALTQFTECLTSLYQRCPNEKFQIQSSLWKYLPFNEKNLAAFVELLNDFDPKFLRFIQRRKQLSNDWDDFLQWFANRHEIMEMTKNRSVMLFILDNCFEKALMRNYSVPQNTKQILRFLTHFYHRHHYALFRDLCTKISNTSLDFSKSEGMQKLIIDILSNNQQSYLLSLLDINCLLNPCFHVLIDLPTDQYTMESLKMFADCLYWKYSGVLPLRYKLVIWTIRCITNVCLYFQ